MGCMYVRINILQDGGQYWALVKALITFKDREVFYLKTLPVA